jgi:hypothetical protein
MTHPETIRQIMDTLRAAKDDLTPSEQEQLRSELLAMALFDRQTGKRYPTENTSSGKGGLTEQEMELIRMLARQTDLLWRIENDPDQ